MYKNVQSESVGNLNILSLNPKIFKKNYLEYSALIEGITLTRDLTNEPSNILTTEEFSKRLESLSKFGLKIKILEEAGILVKHDFKAGKARYEQIRESHHDHLIDVKTGEIIEFVDEEIEKLQKKVAEKYGYKLVDHKLELYGVKKKS